MQHQKMTTVLISSTTDTASTNIKTCLLHQSSWQAKETFLHEPAYHHTTIHDLLLVTIPDNKITHEHLDSELHDALGITPKLMIFLSRHRSKTGKPSLTVHPIGNYGPAEFGGKPQTLIPSAPRLMTHLLRRIQHHLNLTELEFQICYEVTHHGPYLETPTLFVEIGSTEHEWQQPKPGVIIATALLDLFAQYHYEEDFPPDIPVLIGIGGGHYAPRFTDLIFERNAAFGHMIPSYHVDAGNITPHIIEQALQKTPNVTGAYINKKGLKKSQVRLIKTWLQDLGFSSISSKELPVFL